MPQVTRPTLKGYFITDATPTEVQFANLVDSMVYVTVSDPVVTDHGACLIPFVKTATQLDASFIGLAYNPDMCSFMAGENPHATGLASVAFGTDTVASNAFSMAHGTGSRTRRDAERVWSNGSISKYGDAQGFELSLRYKRDVMFARFDLAPGEMITAQCIYSDVSGVGYIFTLIAKADLDGVVSLKSDGNQIPGQAFSVKVNLDSHMNNGNCGPFEILITPQILADTDIAAQGHFSIWGSSVISEPE